MNLTPEAKLASERRTFLFHRADGFYPVDLPKDTVADNAECNPGTLKVMDAITGKTVWENPNPPTDERE